MKRQVSLGLCFTLSLVMVLGSVLSYADTNMALAVDMSDAPMTKDTTTAGSDGDDEDQGDNDQEDAPVTQDTITAGEGSEDDNDKDNSGQNNNDNNNDDNDNEPETEIKDAPNCPAGQENGLFTPCVPIQSCGNNVACCIPPLGPDSNACVNAPLVDHPSTED